MKMRSKSEKQFKLLKFQEMRYLFSRQKLFIASKLWCTYFKPDDVSAACEHSLKKLSLDYLDLYLVHWPFALQRENGLISKKGPGNKYLVDDSIKLIDTWRAMEVKMALYVEIGEEWQGQVYWC